MKILIADDHALFRDSLRSLLEAHGLEVVGEARNGREAVELARKLLQEFARPAQPQTAPQDPDALTDREREVLELLVNGITSNRKLAKQLGVSENTIKFHVRNILDKLHLHNRAQVVSYAIRNRIVEPGS